MTELLIRNVAKARSNRQNFMIRDLRIFEILLCIFGDLR